VAEHYKLTVTSGTGKGGIGKLIIDFLCEEELISDKEVEPVESATALRRLELEERAKEHKAELKVKELQLREKELEIQWRTKELEVAPSISPAETRTEPVFVLSPYRRDILVLAHDTPLGGHLGVEKTYLKVLAHFYWSGLHGDVKRFCKTCHVCQLAWKPNQHPPVVPLVPIPAIEEPFSHIIVDCVRPLPKTRAGNQYLLTMMCASTRFPKAIPLRNTKADKIVKALIKFFTFVELPKVV